MFSPFRPEFSFVMRRGRREAELSKLLFGESARRRVPRNVRIAWVPVARHPHEYDAGRLRTV
jgi:hypothetical protein